MTNRGSSSQLCQSVFFRGQAAEEAEASPTSSLRGLAASSVLLATGQAGCHGSGATEDLGGHSAIDVSPQSLEQAAGTAERDSRAREGGICPHEPEPGGLLGFPSSQFQQFQLALQRRCQRGLRVASGRGYFKNLCVQSRPSSGSWKPPPTESKLENGACR